MDLSETSFFSRVGKTFRLFQQKRVKHHTVTDNSWLASRTFWRRPLKWRSLARSDERGLKLSRSWEVLFAKAKIPRYPDWWESTLSRTDREKKVAKRKNNEVLDRTEWGGPKRRWGTINQNCRTPYKLHFFERGWEMWKLPFRIKKQKAFLQIRFERMGWLFELPSVNSSPSIILAPAKPVKDCNYWKSIPIWWFRTRNFRSMKVR